MLSYNTEFHSLGIHSNTTNNNAPSQALMLVTVRAVRKVFSVVEEPEFSFSVLSFGLLRCSQRLGLISRFLLHISPGLRPQCFLDCTNNQAAKHFILWN